jgi:hypothetical protein
MLNPVLRKYSTNGSSSVPSRFRMWPFTWGGPAIENRHSTLPVFGGNSKTTGPVSAPYRSPR